MCPTETTKQRNQESVATNACQTLNKATIIVSPKLSY